MPPPYIFAWAEILHITQTAGVQGKTHGSWQYLLWYLFMGDMSRKFVWHVIDHAFGGEFASGADDNSHTWTRPSRWHSFVLNKHVTNPRPYAVCYWPVRDGDLWEWSAKGQRGPWKNMAHTWIKARFLGGRLFLGVQFWVCRQSNQHIP